MRIFAKGMAWMAGLLPQPMLELMLNRVIAHRSQSQPADEALRFLFRLEQFAQETAESGLTLVHQEVHWGEVWAELKG